VSAILRADTFDALARSAAHLPHRHVRQLARHRAYASQRHVQDQQHATARRVRCANAERPRHPRRDAVRERRKTLGRIPVEGMASGGEEQKPFSRCLNSRRGTSPTGSKRSSCPWPSKRWDSPRRCPTEARPPFPTKR